MITQNFYKCEPDDRLSIIYYLITIVLFNNKIRIIPNTISFSTQFYFLSFNRFTLSCDLLSSDFNNVYMSLYIIGLNMFNYIVTISIRGYFVININIKI